MLGSLLTTLGTGAVVGGGPAQAEDTSSDALVLTDDSARYPDFVRGNNQRWVGRPETVVLPQSTPQVVKAVQQAVSNGKRISVRSGGHCYEDFVYNAETQVVIDLSGMESVGFDEKRDAFYVEPGATVLNVVETLYRKWGVTIPAGMCYSVGMGGHISGGGWGLLCREFGLTVDHLCAVEVVTVGADQVARAIVSTNAPRDPTRDLWWAHTGGGGGSFGVVTKYWFRAPGSHGTPDTLLPKPPAEVYLHVLALPWAQMSQPDFTALVRNYGRWHEANSAHGGKYDSLMSFLALGHQSNGQLSLMTQMDATLPGALDLLQRFVAEVTGEVSAVARPMDRPMGEFAPMQDHFTAQRIPWLQATRLLGVTNPTLTNPAMRGDFKSAYLRKGFPDTHIEALFRHLTRTDFVNPNAMVVASSYGGKVNTIESADTATPHRDSIIKLLYQAYWSDPGQDTANIKWLRDMYQDVYAATGGVPVSNEVTDGCYINYADIDLNSPEFNRSSSPWWELYFGANYPRLQQAKARWDPLNIFRHGQSVRLPGS
ncbi:FAD-binding oxidoreductase (plasmid) [Rhodococcus sp. 21391]|nr:FAD-binding oxidoreductase [Rhodococcus sp. 21391]